MPAFLNKVFKRENSAAAKRAEAEAAAAAKPVEVKYQDAWFRTSVTPEDVQELLRGCTNEIKHRGLSTPFLLLPFRPNSDPSAARTFIRQFFNPATGPLRGEQLQQELRLTEPVVLCSTLKWCWSRLPGGVVTWDVYELFRQGEVDSSMARDSFATFIPISAESDARSKIIFDFFDLISAIAAHGKHNGLGGMKLSRLAGWWAFEHTDLGWGFEGGYASWSRAADATAHMFFAYLRSLSPAEGAKGVSVLPISLKALLASVDYPPTAPSQLQSSSVRVVITVENVSPTPFALLRRARNFRYDERERALRAFVEYEDPVQALTDECKRVLKCISSTNQSSAGAFKTSTGLQEQSWSRFQDMGFSGLLEEDDSGSEADVDGLSMRGSETFRRRRASTQPATPRQSEGVDLARPTTPSWADFMSSGFGDRDQGGNAPKPLLLPPDKVLPPIDTDSRAKTSQSHRKIDESLDQGELSSVAPMNVDDAFWWVWMSSLAGEEPTQRKAVFGRCALVETVISGGRWLIVEEKVKGAAVKPEEVPAKDKKWTKRSRLGRRRSVGRNDAPVEAPAKFDPSLQPTLSRTKIGPDQAAKIQAAAMSLRQQQTQLENQSRSPAGNQRSSARTHSVFTLQPVILSEATPAMKWASKYDRDAIRDAYLNNLPLSDGPSRPDTERSLPALPTEDPDEEVEEKKPRPVSMMPPPPVPMSKPEPLNRSERTNGSDNKPAPISKVIPVTPSPTFSPMNHPALIPPSPSTNGRASPAPLSPPLSPPGQMSRTSNSSTPEKIKKASRFMSFFSSNKKSEPAATGRLAPQPIENSSNASLTLPNANLGRRLSMQKKKNAPVTFQGTVTESNQGQLMPSATPTSSTPEPRPQRHESGSSNPGSEEVRVATQAFSSFDQGPLDAPAFIPDDSPDVTEPSSPAVETRPTVPEKEDSVSISEDSAPNSPPDAMPVQDRWAQIRKNAAERAKVVPKASEDSDARGSIDDGETSGEETIESRVARIKARVAELTGNMDTNRV